MIDHMEDNPFKSHLAVEEYYETAISKFSPERIETYHRSARKDVRAVNLECMRSGSAGFTYNKLVQKAMHTASCDKLLRNIAGFYSAFTTSERAAIKELLKTHDRLAYDRRFWNTDSARVLDDVCEFLEALPDLFEDRIKYAMFELITNNFAVIAINVAEVREIAEIPWFPWRN
jgi:hypothetical protein